jgi:hypothetical protein
MLQNSHGIRVIDDADSTGMAFMVTEGRIAWIPDFVATVKAMPWFGGQLLFGLVLQPFLVVVLAET